MLLDNYLPEFDVRTSYATRIAASPARVYASLWTANFDHWGITRALYAVRTLPSFPSQPRETWRRFRDELFRQRFTLDEMLLEDFALLEEQPGEELVLGTVGRFWRARGELCATSPVQFRATAPSGTAKAAWNFEVGIRADGATELRTETRILCADVATRRRFRAYWMLIRPFSGLIRQEMLAAVRSAAESDQRRSYQISK
ncbi:MAG TPA: hypothetical protein VK638_36210 [Edaphobacter sp.]|nr:hypothetical protein [Edaphobacter sp.]